MERNSGPRERGGGQGGSECWQGWAMDALDEGDSGNGNGVLGLILLK